MSTFLHISDTHISADPNYHPPWIPRSVPHPNRGAEALLAAIQRLPFAIDFILHTGDVCADPKPADYRCARELLRQAPAPMYLLPGNHDSAAHMLDILHDGQRFYVLRDAQTQIGACRLITLDSAAGGDEHAPHLRDEQIDWLARQLEAIDDGLAVLALHHPLIETGVPWLDQEMRVQNGERIQHVLARHSAKIAAVFHGHIHQQTTAHSDGLLHVSSQSTWSNLAAYPGLRDGEADASTPGGFNLVMLRGKRVFVRRYSLPILAR